MEKFPKPTQIPPRSKNDVNAFLYEGVAVIASNRVVTEDGIISATMIILKDTGKIIVMYPTVLPRAMFALSTPYHDYSPHVLMPGLVDTHVHVNEPGRTSTEGFFTATQAAIFGGVTTIVDMPLNSIPATTSVVALDTKIKAATDKCWCDVGFLGGIIPGNLDQLKPLVNAGVRGFKAFLINSGVPEFPSVSYNEVRDAMLELADSPTMIMFHAEKIPSRIPDFERLKKDPPYLYPNGDRKALHVYNNFLAARPPVFEDDAIEMLVDLCQFAPALPIHIAHVSTFEALPILRQAQEKGVNISAETCFHYLTLSAEEVPLNDTRFKSEPPIRSKYNQDQLWSALRRLASGEDEKKMIMKPPKKDLRLGPITTIVSDHSPCSPQAKLLPSYIPPHPEPGEGQYHDDAMSTENGDFFRAWGGIASVGLGLPVLWTEFYKRNWNVDSTSPLVELDDPPDDPPEDPPEDPDLEAALIDVAEWCCRNTAELVGLGAQKGRLKVGYDGDICVFDPSATWVLEGKDLLFKHKMSPYEGRTLRGRVMATWLRGNMVWSLEDGIVGTEPQGKLLLEKRSPQKPDPEQIEGSREMMKDRFDWRWLLGVMEASFCGCGGLMADYGILGLQHEGCH